MKSKRSPYQLESLVEVTRTVPSLRREDTVTGDHLVVETRGSVYNIQIGDGGMCIVSGGWFDKNGTAPIRTRVVGATLGGSAVAVDLLAACGMRVEFGGRIITSTVRRVALFKKSALN